MPAKPSERQYRILSSPLAPAAGDGDNKRIDTDFYVEGYASTFNDPYVLFEDWDGNEYREIISPELFDYLLHPTVLYGDPDRSSETEFG